MKIKNSIFVIVCTLVFGIVLSSCSKTVTYAQRLKNEKKTIDKFISKENIVILSSIPTDTVFGEKEFYQDKATGVYFNIVDRGDLSQKAQLDRDVYVRFSHLRYISADNDTTEYSNKDPRLHPFGNSFRFKGYISLENKQLYANTTPAWIVPLKYIGENGIVKLIVPFNMGATSDIQNFNTTYYGNISYRFDN